MSRKKYRIDDFEIIENRVKTALGIEKSTSLIEIIGTSQPTYSRRKSENNFKIEWAYSIAAQKKLSTDWIMTGEGPKNRENQTQPTEIDSDYLSQVIFWFKEITLQDPRKKTWFEIQFEKAFPEFVEWINSRHSEEEKRKVA